MEEKNKAVVVKSVQRGSLAEVRLLGGAVLAGAGVWGISLQFLREHPGMFLLTHCPCGATQSRAALFASPGGVEQTPRLRAVLSVRVPPAPSAGPAARRRDRAEGF